MFGFFFTHIFHLYFRVNKNGYTQNDNRTNNSSGTQKGTTSAKLNEAKNAGYCPRVLSQANEVKIAKTIKHHSAGVDKVMNFVAKVSSFRFNSGGNAGKKDKDDKKHKIRILVSTSL